jgi:hypothetical protein
MFNQVGVSREMIRSHNLGQNYYTVRVSVRRLRARPSNSCDMGYFTRLLQFRIYCDSISIVSAKLAFRLAPYGAVWTYPYS